MSSVNATPSPDPAVEPDAGQFFRLALIDHLEECTEDDCFADTRLTVLTETDGDPMPYCAAHAHVLFADWMVGV